MDDASSEKVSVALVEWSEFYGGSRGAGERPAPDEEMERPGKADRDSRTQLEEREGGGGEEGDRKVPVEGKWGEK